VAEGDLSYEDEPDGNVPAGTTTPTGGVGLKGVGVEGTVVGILVGVLVDVEGTVVGLPVGFEGTAVGVPVGVPEGVP